MKKMNLGACIYTACSRAHCAQSMWALMPSPWEPPCSPLLPRHFKCEISLSTVFWVHLRCHKWHFRYRQVFLTGSGLPHGRFTVSLCGPGADFKLNLFFSLSYTASLSPIHGPAGMGLPSSSGDVELQFPSNSSV